MPVKALGIVRKLDELGRIVIPMEVRKTQGWAEGQPMEFFVEGDQLVIKAYGRENEKKGVLQALESLLKNPNTPDHEDLVLEIIDFVAKG